MEIIWDLILKGRKDTGLLKVWVQGKSMEPSLRPGDSVLIEPASPDDLCPGDVVLIRGKNGFLLHRFLGYTPQGWLLTQGDACIYPDPPFPPEALLGKAVSIERNGRVQGIPCHHFRLKLQRGLRKGSLWLKSFLRLFFALVILQVFMILPIHAAVTLVSFTASPQGQAVVVRWETASEVNMLGFYIWRSTEEGESYSRISDLIPAEGDIVGASYQFIDTAVEPGRIYFYKLEAVETTGASQFYGPVSATVPAPTPTPNPSPTITPTPSPTSPPTFTPTPSPTSSPTFTPTPSPVITPTPSPTSSPTFTPTPFPTFTPVPYPTSTFIRPPTPTFTLAPMPKPSPTPIPTLTYQPISAFTSPLLPAFTPSPTPLPTFIPPRNVPPPFPTLELLGISSPSPWKLWAFLIVGGFLGCAMILLGALSLKEARKRG